MKRINEILKALLRGDYDEMTIHSAASRVARELEQARNQLKRSPPPTYSEMRGLLDTLESLKALDYLLKNQLSKLKFDLNVMAKQIHITQ